MSDNRLACGIDTKLCAVFAVTATVVVGASFSAPALSMSTQGSDRLAARTGMKSKGDMASITVDMNANTTAYKNDNDPTLYVKKRRESIYREKF